MKVKNKILAIIFISLIVGVRCFCYSVFSELYGFPIVKAEILSGCYYFLMLSFAICLGVMGKGLKQIGIYFVVEFLLIIISTMLINVSEFFLKASTFLLAPHGLLIYLPSHFKPFSFFLYMALANLLLFATGFAVLKIKKGRMEGECAFQRDNDFQKNT